jgi:nitrite reductase (NADH) large subunit
MIKARRPTVVVVGTGMAGGRVVEEVLARAPDRFHVRMFGDEPHGTYNRILLSSVLGGFADPNKLWLNPLEWYESHGVHVHAGVRVEQIDRSAKLVAGAAGKVVEPYDHLILATGSRPFVPPIDGTRQQGVFVFRTLDDCSAIGSFARECDRAVVIGGGLLGLEAARGLLTHDVEVTVVEAAPHLMPQQLDPIGADLLRQKMEALGVRVLVGKATAGLTGTGRVTGVRFGDGSTLDADMVVISCGIRPNANEAKAAGLLVDRGIVVDDQLRTSDPDVFAVGECAQHKGICYGIVDPLYEQARVLADVLTGSDSCAAYRGSRLATTLKVMGVEMTSMGDFQGVKPGTEVVSHLDPAAGVYRKLVVRDGKLAGALLVGTSDAGGILQRMFKADEPMPATALELLSGGTRDALLTAGCDIAALADDTQICNCNSVCKGTIAAAIQCGCKSVDTIGKKTRAGTGCGTCQPLLEQLIGAYAPGRALAAEDNKIEVMKQEKNGLDCLDDLLSLVPGNNWQEMTENDKQRAKWYGLFFRKQTPGNFMMRLRFNAGRGNARQLRVIADLSDEYGKGFADLTSRQQLQLRWFSLGDVPAIWQRLEDVGMHSMQTGMDNVRGICGCPLSGLTPHELLDASPVIDEYNDMLVGNRDFTNLPRKFNVTITGCLENCCHVETQDIGLVPAYRELDGQQVNGFNVLVGGKQGSGGFTPAKPLDVFVTPQDAAALCREITFIFRDHGARGQRTRARLAFLIQDRGINWFRAELARRFGKHLLKAGADMRKAHHVDHLGIQPQKRQLDCGLRIADCGLEERTAGFGSDPAVCGIRNPQSAIHNQTEPLYSLGLMVPVGRITTAQMRGVADLAERYGNGDIRLTVQQNVIIPNIPESRIGAVVEEPLLKELPHDPSPIMRGLVSCTGIDYCHMALIETKGWAVEVARELERRTAGHKVQPLTIHWSGCPAGCGMHQVSTIGLQGCRSRVNGNVVDAAHVTVNGQTGPHAHVSQDLMYDVPCDQLADALLPLVKHLPRK